MESPGNMEAIMAIGVGYVFMLTPAIIVFWCYAPNKTVLKSGWMPRTDVAYFGEVVGVDEISQSLINLRGSHPCEPGASYSSPRARNMRS